jgi:hypothetical protein
MAGGGKGVLLVGFCLKYFGVGGLRREDQFWHRDGARIMRTKNSENRNEEREGETE